MTEFLAYPLVRGALSGLGAAVLVDLGVFLKAKAPGEFFAQWNLQVALWRWAQGMVGGALTALGLGAV